MIELGWREWALLPDLGLPRMRAKIDTGARTSALHVDASWRFAEGGAPWVGFRVRCGRRRERTVEAMAPLVDEREVVDSGGHRGLRPFLRTTLWLAGQARPVEINLTDRGSMTSLARLDDIPAQSYTPARRLTSPLSMAEVSS